MWLCVFVFYVSYLDISPHKSSRFKANPQDMREHEWKSNYIRTAILLLSFVIIVVIMISALKIFKSKRMWPNNSFQCKNFKDLHIYTHTYTYAQVTLIYSWYWVSRYLNYLIWTAHLVRKYYSWDQVHEFKF